MNSISVVIPAYNVEKYIIDTIESLLSQTVLPDEIIIINDGSQDKTLSLVLPYVNNPIIKLFDTPNRGQGEARNRGLIESSSEYIYFFDSDDLLKSNFIEEMKIKILEYDSPDIILFSGESFLDKDFEYKALRTNNYDRRFNGHFNNSYKLISSLMKYESFFASPCLYISKKQLWLDKCLKFKPILHEDDDILFELTAVTQTSLVLNDRFFYRRVRSSSIMTSKFTTRNLEGYIESLKSMYTFKNKHPLLYNKLKPLWKRKLTHKVLTIFKLMKELQIPSYDPILLKSLFDLSSIELIHIFKRRIIKHI